MLNGSSKVITELDTADEEGRYKWKARGCTGQVVLRKCGGGFVSMHSFI